MSLITGVSSFHEAPVPVLQVVASPVDFNSMMEEKKNSSGPE
jgi:hypothetical protein